MKSFKRFLTKPGMMLIFVSFFILPLVAINCGGGGGGGGGGGDGDTGNTVQQGVFLDSAVEGIDYETLTQSGETDPNGAFDYMSGETVTFSIGDLVIGTASGQETITPVDMVAGATDETDPTVTNISIFLLGLDEDGDPSNGILISDDIADIVSEYDIDFDQPTDDFLNDQNTQDLLDELNNDVFTDSIPRDWPSADDAQIHLEGTLTDIDGGDSDGGGGDGAQSLYIRVDTDELNDGSIDRTRYYTRNSDGTVATIEYDDDNDGIIDRTTENTYDANGNLIKTETETMGETMGFIIVAEYTHIYDGDDIIQTDRDSYQKIGETEIGKGNVDVRHTFTYDSSGNQTREESDLMADGSIESVTTFEYDNAGNQVTINDDFDNDGTVDLVTSVTYDSNNRLTSTTIDGKLDIDDTLPDGTPEATSQLSYSNNRLDTMLVDVDADGIYDLKETYIYD